MKLFYKGKSNALKIICLAFGVTAGLLLVARVHFDNTIDTYFDDYERVYVVNSNVIRENDKQPRTFSQVSGAIAPHMMLEIPEVEKATRHTYIFDEDAKYIIDEEGTSKEINMICRHCMVRCIQSANHCRRPARCAQMGMRRNGFTQYSRKLWRRR